MLDSKLAHIRMTSRGRAKVVDHDGQQFFVGLGQFIGALGLGLCDFQRRSQFYFSGCGQGDLNKRLDFRRFPLARRGVDHRETADWLTVDENRHAKVCTYREAVHHGYRSPGRMFMGVINDEGSCTGHYVVAEGPPAYLARGSQGFRESVLALVEITPVINDGEKTCRRANQAGRETAQ